MKTEETYYSAQWPIEDESLTAAQLVTIAKPDLYRMLRQDKIEPTGQPEWTVSEHAGQPFLSAKVPARRAEQ